MRQLHKIWNTDGEVILFCSLKTRAMQKMQFMAVMDITLMATN
jgi:hypothetical protein